MNSNNPKGSVSLFIPLAGSDFGIYTFMFRNAILFTTFSNIILRIPTYD